MIAEADPERFFQKTRCTLETRPNDLDMLGHVNHAVALEYLEAARWDWARRVGVRIARPPAIVVAVTRIEVDYLAEIAPGRIDVETAFVSPGPDWMEGANYKATVRQSIACHETGKELVRATVGLAFVDTTTRLLCTLQECLAAHANAVAGS
jgi:acyl-CoA thioester hydrolase